MLHYNSKGSLKVITPLSISRRSLTSATLSPELTKGHLFAMRLRQHRGIWVRVWLCGCMRWRQIYRFSVPPFFFIIYKEHCTANEVLWLWLIIGLNQIWIISSSSTNISDELRVEKSVLFALVLGDEADACHDDQYKDEWEEELDEVRAVSCGLSWGLKLCQ